MISRYPDLPGATQLVDTLLHNATNLLSRIYSRIYFPIHSNSLKDIASYLGFRWTHSGASGLYSIMWRSQWERSRDTALRERLVYFDVFCNRRPWRRRPDLIAPDARGTSSMYADAPHASALHSERPSLVFQHFASPVSFRAFRLPSRVQNNAS